MKTKASEVRSQAEGGKAGALRRRQGERMKLDDALALQKQVRDTQGYAREVIESGPPLLVLDGRLRVLTANESFRRCFKMSLRATLNRKVYELGNGQWNIPKLRTLLEEVLPTKSHFKDFEVTHEFEGIGRRTILLSGRKVDHLERILLFFEDVTERRKSQDALKASEVRYRRLFEAAKDGILILDAVTRKITDSNPFMSKLLGYPRRELLDKELWEIGLLKDERASRAAFRELQKNHFIRYEDLPLRNKSGERREVEFVSNLYHEDGKKVIQCNIRDITERRRAEDELKSVKDEISRHALVLEQVVKERTNELRETIAELEGFSYSLSHDMRAPLRAMQSFSQFLLDDYVDKLDEKGVNYLQQIMRSAVRLDRLIQDVLSYTTILHAELPMESVSLDELVRDLVASFLNGQKVQPEVRIHGVLPIVKGNEALLAQCISNLLSNAGKFVRAGTVPRIDISCEEIAGEGIRIVFQDNGIGIAAEDGVRIFRLFERVHPSTEFEGTGIGLTIVRKATERMDAQVGFTSVLGQGSRFWIQFKKG